MVKKIFCTCLFLCMLSSCGTNTVSVEEQLEPMKIAIYPAGTNSESYLININSDGIFEMAFGERTSDDFQSQSFLNIKKRKEKTLSNDQISVIDKLQAEIVQTNDVSKDIASDAWVVVISTQNHTYQFNYGEYLNESYGKLVEKLIKYSPLKIDLHGWA